MAFFNNNGILTYQGSPLREFGLVVPDLFLAWLANSNPSLAPTAQNPVIYQSNYATNFAAIQALGFRVIRFALFGFYPLTYSASYVNANSTFVANLDALFASAESYGMLLIPSLFFNGGQLAPYYGEHLSAIGNPASQTYAAMQQITAFMTNRYGNHPALAMLEFGNEYDNRIGNNAYFDSLSSTSPDNAQALSPTMGTPSSWTYPQDCYTEESVVDAQTAFQATVKSINPNVATMSGNQGIQSVSLSYSQPQFIQNRIAQDATDTLTAHTYYSNPFYNTDYLNYPQYIQNLKAAAKAAGKPLIIGEWGIPTNYGSLSGSARAYQQQQIRVASFIAQAEIQLALLWNYPSVSGTDATYDFSSNGTRSSELQYLANFNAQYRAGY